ncbi:MAG: primosomal protein N' [Limnothrix sp.]
MVSQLSLVEVLVDCTYTQGLFTYSIPLGLGVDPGDIVSVRFGTQQLGAIAIRLTPDLPVGLDPQQVRPVESIIAKDFFSPHYWQLLLQVADYYQTKPMGVIKMALPSGLLQRSQPRVRLVNGPIAEAQKVGLPPIVLQILALLEGASKDGYSTKYLTKQVKSAAQGIEFLQAKGWVERYLKTPRTAQIQQKKTVTYISYQEKLTKRQQEVLQILRHEGGEMWLDELVGVAKTTAATVQRMANLGAVAIAAREKLRLHQSPNQDLDQKKQLTSAQKNAVETVNQVQGYAEVLLHGVTGSGKTEVYLQAIAPILKKKQSVLVLVPEIGLTPQLVDRFQSRFGHQVLTYHSGLSEGERYDTWRQMLRPDSQVVIGTRSAVFSPLPNLGMIILDEEHDSSYKEDQRSPHYHARTVARWRAQQEKCPLILGSATPALDTWQNFHPPKNTEYHYLSLPERIQSRPLPPVEIVDMRHELRAGNYSPFSKSLEKVIARISETDEQGILFVARRGHSTFVSCRSCGYKMTCPYCDVALSYHYVREGSAQILRCHYCNHNERQPKLCPDCGSSAFKFFGNGTQKIAQALKQNFPNLRCLRFDSDTTRRKGAHRDLLGQFTRGEADILLGTQMLTKGLDIAQVTLVGIIAADGLLFQSGYRAAERTFQTLTQVAGRAGRGEMPGQVILQTYSPEHPVIQAVKTHDYAAFSQQALAEREELNYPPFGKLVLLRCTGENQALVEKTIEAIADHCCKIIGADTEMLGPVPANILRIAGRYRWQIVLKFPTPDAAIPDLTFLRQYCPSQINLSINVDPLYID